MKSDTIYRQAAIDMFQNLAYDDWNQGVSTTWANAFAESADMIKELPSAQPEIITCIDCIHYTPLGKDKAWGRCPVHCSPTENQRMCQSCDYCSWAERRTDG